MGLLSLDQGDPAVEPVHEQRRRQADGEVYDHGEEDNLDRLSSLVENGAGKDRDKIGIADRDGERGVLGEIQVLARQGWDDHPHRLRDDHQPERRAGTKAEGTGGLGLPVGHRKDPGPHDLGDVGSRVQAQAEKECYELRLDVPASDEIEALQLGKLECKRRASREEYEDRKSDEEGKARPQHWKGLPCRALPAARPLADDNDGKDAEEERDASVDQLGPTDRPWQQQAAIAEIGPKWQLQSLARARQNREDGLVPEEKL